MSPPASYSYCHTAGRIRSSQPMTYPRLLDFCQASHTGYSTTIRPKTTCCIWYEVEAYRCRGVDANFECTNGGNCDGDWKKNKIKIVHDVHLRYDIKWIIIITDGIIRRQALIKHQISGRHANYIPCNPYP